MPARGKEKGLSINSAAIEALSKNEIEIILAAKTVQLRMDQNGPGKPTRGGRKCYTPKCVLALIEAVNRLSSGYWVYE